MAGYHVVTTCAFDAPIERVWAALEALERYPSWQRDAVAAGPGPTVRLKGRAPLRLSVELTVASAEAPRTLVMRAAGDLAGVGAWTLAERGAGTSASWTWDVRAVGGWARVLGPLARPLVGRGLERLTRRVAADLAGLLGTRAPIGLA